jgi:hypothetical protein
MWHFSYETVRNGLTHIHTPPPFTTTLPGAQSTLSLLSFSVPAGAVVLALAVMLAAPQVGPYMSAEQLKFPHPAPDASRYVVMDDGVRLAADVYLPVGATVGGNDTVTSADNNDTVVTMAATSVPVVIQPTRTGRAREVSDFCH